MSAFIRDTRRFKRLKVDVPVTFHVESETVRLRDKKDVQGAIRDLSAGGAAIITSVFIPKGSVVIIDIDLRELMPKFKEPIRIDSRVIHTQARVISLKVGTEKTFRMGVQFLKLTAEQQAIIVEFVEKQLKESGEDDRS